MASKVVIVDDELLIQEELDYMLSKEGFETFTIDKFENVVEKISEINPDIVLLDLNLPNSTGFEICKFLREKSGMAILILTSSEQIKDELHALHLGADDFMTKPFHKDRLIARINNLIRRNKDNLDCIIYKDMKLDLKSNLFYYNNRTVNLTDNQSSLTELLLSNVGMVVEKKKIFEELWGSEEFVDENILQVNMTRLKKTLSPLELQYEIETVRGIGYRLVERERTNSG